MSRPMRRLRKAPPPYRVRITPTPTVIDEQGQPIDSATVLDIRFPGAMADAAAGQPIVSAPGMARILVGAITVRGVPLC